jgi:hypothetical protein
VATLLGLLPIVKHKVIFEEPIVATLLGLLPIVKHKMDGLL